MVSGGLEDTVVVVGQTGQLDVVVVGHTHSAGVVLCVQCVCDNIICGSIPSKWTKR